MTAEIRSLERAREELRARQGLGARYDAPNAPARELDWARRGTAYFARKFHELSDSDLDGASLVPGWSRRHVAAQVAYHARALTRLTEWARTGVVQAMYPSPEEKAEEIIWGATLPSGALRHLVAHAEVHLNVEWRDLAEADWDKPLRGDKGEPITARDTAWMRAKEIWLRAVDLANGGSFADFPPDFIDRLIAERMVALKAERPDLDFSVAINGEAAMRPAGIVVSGTRADIARWLHGYGARRLTCDPPGSGLPQF